MKIESIKSSPLAKGKSELMAYMQGNPLSRAQAMRAKCFECMNGFIDGRVDCKVPDCPLYDFMPYRENPRLASGASKSARTGAALARWRRVMKGQTPDPKQEQ